MVAAVGLESVSISVKDHRSWDTRIDDDDSKVRYSIVYICNSLKKHPAVSAAEAAKIEDTFGPLGEEREFSSYRLTLEKCRKFKNLIDTSPCTLTLPDELCRSEDNEVTLLVHPVTIQLDHTSISILETEQLAALRARTTAAKIEIYVIAQRTENALERVTRSLARREWEASPAGIAERVRQHEELQRAQEKWEREMRCYKIKEICLGQRAVATGSMCCIITGSVLFTSVPVSPIVSIALTAIGVVGLLKACCCWD